MVNDCCNLAVMFVVLDEVESWFIAVVLLISFLVVSVAVVLIFLAVWYSYKVCRMIYPDAKLPEHLKQVKHCKHIHYTLQTQFKTHFHVFMCIKYLFSITNTIFYCNCPCVLLLFFVHVKNISD